MPAGLKKAALGIGAVLLLTMTLGLASSLLYVGSVTSEIDDRFAQLRSTRATQFFALYPPLRVGQRFRPNELQSYLVDQGYLEKRAPEDLVPGEYAMVTRGDTVEVALVRPAFNGVGLPLEAVRARLVFRSIGGTLHLETISRADDNQPFPQLDSVPKKIGSFFGGRLRTQNFVPISEIPTSMRLAVMAIEDIHFLEHSGVSIRGTLRALWKDLKARKWVEGGSTLTQQLMKNLFFSREKSLSRKAKEALYAFITESRHSKEAILEAYLNEIYLGQWGTREIHGVSEGAQIFFNRPVTQLSVPQSATLAAIIQAPNAQDPHRYPDRLIKRRNLVLKKMLDAGFLLPDEYEMAVREPLGVVPGERSLNDVDYFTDLILERMSPDIRSRLDTDALTVYATLNPYLQSVASKALNTNLERLRKLSPKIREQEKKGKPLESGLIAIDVKECSVVALQGGHDYRATQFNRILQGKRQPGSLFKPFVFLAAFAQSTESDPVTPLTEFDDSAFEWKFDKQVWKPKNYDPEFRGKVTVRETLEQSINTSTARIAQKVGIPYVVETLARAGIRTPLPGLPSISLGAAEVTPIELAEAYLTMANLGKSCALRSFLKVYDENGNLVTETPKTDTQALPPVPTFQTVHVMKGVFTRGTARAAQASGLSLGNFAGKTGTTNEAKDAWFVGFSPNILTLVWVGYDEHDKVGLSGATAALPLWVDFIKGAQPFLANEDFVKPDGLEPIDVDLSSRSRATAKCPDIQVEYFQPGTTPKDDCPLHR